MNAPQQREPAPCVVGKHTLWLLRDGAQAFPHMLAMIRNAQREVLLEMYWFASDTTGQRFADALCVAAQRGVRVSVIYDALGSFGVDPAMFERMREAGCEVAVYKPLAPWRKRFKVAGLARRNHRKLLVVDGRWAATGGVNLGDPWLPKAEGGEGWRDEMVAVEGPAAAVLRNIIADTWQHDCGMKALAHLPESRADVEADKLSVLVTKKRRAHRDIRETYLERIRTARHSIVIANAYFLPDRVIRRALQHASQRGVRVSLMVPGMSDVPAIFWATRYLYSRFLRWGVEIYEWRKSVLHSKVVVADEQWVSIGTYNLDYLSWLSNLEVALGIEHPRFAAEVTMELRDDLAGSYRIDPARWAKRPLYYRALSRFFFTFRKFF